MIPAALWLAAIPGQAASVWNGGGGDANLSTPGNWVGGIAPVSDQTTTIQMAGTANLNVNVDAPFTLTNLTFNSGSGAFVLGGSTLSIFNTSNNNTSLENNSTSAVTINNNILMLGSALFRTTSGNMTLNGNIDLNGNNLTLRPLIGKTMTVNGVISGSSSTSLSYNGNDITSIAKMNGANTYAGSTSVFAGTVIVGVSDVGTPGALTSGAFGISTGAVGLGAGSGTFDAAVETGGAYTVTRNFQMVSSDTAAITLGGSTAAASTFSGTITNGTASAAAHAFTLTAATGGRVNFTGNIVRATGATGTADSMTKTGAGVVALSGSIGHLGTTAVNAGTLLINGTMTSGGGVVSVASGATLGGNGTINRAVNFSSGGILSAGDMDAAGAISQAGTLTIGGDLALVSGSTLKFDLGTVSDLVAVTGNLTLGGSLNVLAGSGFGAGSYELFSYTGTLTNNGLSLGTLPGGFSYTIDTSTPNLVDLVVVAAPEPGILALLGVAGAGAFLMRRRLAGAV